MPKKKDFVFSLSASNDIIADHLEALARGFRSGEIILAMNEKELALQPIQDIDLDLHAKIDGIHQSVSFSMHWYSKTGEKPDLSIRSGKD